MRFDATQAVEQDATPVEAKPVIAADGYRADLIRTTEADAKAAEREHWKAYYESRQLSLENYFFYGGSEFPVMNRWREAREQKAEVLARLDERFLNQTPSREFNEFCEKQVAKLAEWRARWSVGFGWCVPEIERCLRGLWDRPVVTIEHPSEVYRAGEILRQGRELLGIEAV